MQVDAAEKSGLVGVESQEVASLCRCGVLGSHNGILKKEAPISIKHMQWMA